MGIRVGEGDDGYLPLSNITERHLGTGSYRSKRSNNHLGQQLGPIIRQGPA